MNVQVFKTGDTWTIDPQALLDYRFQEEIGRHVKDGQVQLRIDKPGKRHSRAQENLWHKLVSLYYRSGLHSSNEYDSLRLSLKYRYGVINSYIYILPDGEITVLKPYEEPPIRYVDKYADILSTAAYDKRQYSRLIDGTSSEMLQVGVIDSPKCGAEFEEILRSLEAERAAALREF